jgi:hypothetical protein
VFGCRLGGAADSVVNHVIDNRVITLNFSTRL